MAGKFPICSDDDMIPEDVGRLYILKTRNRKTGIVDSHLAYFSSADHEMYREGKDGKPSLAVYACSDEPVLMKMQCGVDYGYPVNDMDMDEFDQYCNEVTCEKCLAIARG